MIAELLVASLVAFSPVQGKAPEPAPQCETQESIAASLIQGTTVLATLTGDEAQRLNRELGGETPPTVDTIVIYVNPQYPSIAFVVGFLNGCSAAQGMVQRAFIDRFRGAV